MVAVKPMSNEEYNARILQFMNESRAKQGLPPVSTLQGAGVQEEQAQSPVSSGASSGAMQIAKMLGNKFMSSGKASPGASTGSSPLSSLLGGGSSSGGGGGLSSFLGGGSPNASSSSGPFMFDTTTGAPVGSSASGTPTWTSSGMEGGASGVQGALNVAIPAAGTYGMYDTLKKERSGFRGAGQGALSGAAMLYPFGPVGMAIGAVAGGTAGYFGDKGWNPLRMDTKDYQKSKWRSLAKNNPTAQAMWNLKQQQWKDPNNGTWQTGKYAGQKWTFEKAADLAKDDPSIFRNEFGNLNTFGSDWNKYNDSQKDAITKALLGENLYESKRGIIKIKDEGKAREIAAKTINTPISPGDKVKTAVKNALEGKKDAKAK